jgi:hypothetical protein
VTLDGVTINGINSGMYAWAGITCEGNATIILKDGTTNTVKGFKNDYPGIYVPKDKTLTIKGETAGTGSLTVSSNGYGPGIGGRDKVACGNIEIQGGKITATGGYHSAGIGSGSNESCGSISIKGGEVTANGGEFGSGIGSSSKGTCGAISISGGKVTANGGNYGAGIGSGSFAPTCGAINISGGTVTATGGDKGAGIGSGNNASCGDIKITSGVTKVTAKKGGDAPNSIGKGAGVGAFCGTVTIGGNVGAKTASPYVYPTPALSLTSPTVGQVIGSDGKNYAANATLPTGVTKVAMIAYVSGSNGLAIALADESGSMNWSTAKTTCEAKTPAFTGGTWKLPSLDEWKNMLTYDGDSYWNNNLQTALSTAGGNSLQEWMYYWSSTDYVSDNTQACDVEFMSGYANFSNEYKTYTTGMLVRAVLAF